MSYYRQLYNTLYQIGYHKDKNHGQILVEYILDHYPDFITILEAGCSNGKAVEYLNAHGKKAKGFDISDVAIKNSGNPNCYAASVIEIPETDNSYDAVFSCDMLEHLHPDEVKKAVSELIRVTRKYLFIKICPAPEKNRGWIEILHKRGLYRDLPNLHTNVLPIDTWINFFQGVILLENHQNLLVMEKSLK